jgi:hypothetical protein
MVFPAGVLMGHMDSVVITAELIVVYTIWTYNHLRGSTAVDHCVARHALSIKHPTKNNTTSFTVGSFNHLVNRDWSL